MADEMLRTSLYAEHKRLGARFAPFAAWEMPIRYATIRQEHMAVREAAGLFDVSHMGELLVEGPGAAAGLHYALTHDVLGLETGQARYTLLLNEDGGTRDDLLIYRLAADQFLCIVNAANVAGDRQLLAHILAAYDCTLADISRETALLALQGPQASSILKPLLSGPLELGFFRFEAEVPVGDTVALVSRSGYTGEDGFELALAWEDAPALWRSLLAAGEELGLAPCGLGARDSLRLEAALCLYGHELSETIDPVTAGLEAFIAWDKDDFHGAAALRRIKAAGPSRRRIGLVMEGRAIPRQDYPIELPDGTPAGRVTSGGLSPVLEQPIGMGLVAAAHAAPGTSIRVRIRERPHDAAVTALPFYRRG